MNERRVRAIMQVTAPAVSENAPLREVVRLMTTRRIRHLCVLRGEELVGIISDSDLTRAMPRSFRGEGAQPGKVLDVIPAANIMTKQPITVGAEAPLSEAIERMNEFRVGALPVLDHGRLVGLVTEADCLRHSFRQRLQARASAA